MALFIEHGTRVGYLQIEESDMVCVDLSYPLRFDVGAPLFLRRTQIGSRSESV